MKNITVSIPADTYHSARVWAAEHKTSLSRIVARLLKQMAEQPRAKQQSPLQHPAVR
jgi:hypothetical protein